ncbi:hypothetical protein GCM10011519_19820 [Marmoricola endophyticus]|uniref:Uncharacterized protein n=1 Tax=Marmoricola endophyticus TaxID=2040280 RepID=A0A917BK53_9ACTN|nr:hypothetical protein [Marmoricola endophyticus]GGF45986.1 hypothetical protein GCM10011519_19820 [Marmoricola endophyticus]
MTVMPRPLRLEPLRTSSGVLDRLRALGGSPLMTFSAVLLVLMVVAFAGVLAFVVAGGHADESVTFWLMPAFFVVVGCWGLTSIWRTVGEAGSLTRFARENHLLTVAGTLAPDYAGSLFATRVAAVDRSVRTRGRDFVEVGDRFPVAGRLRLDALTTAPGALAERELFLRARLAGGAAGDRALGARVPADLAQRLRRFAGERYRVELAADELTVFGSEPLGIDHPVRMREAFDLIDALAAANSAEQASTLDTTPTSTPRGRGPLRVVLGVVAMLVVVPIGFAVVMSAADALLGHGSLAGALVLALVAVIAIVVGLVVRHLLTPTVPPAEETPRP